MPRRWTLEDVGSIVGSLIVLGFAAWTFASFSDRLRTTIERRAKAR